MCRPVIERLQAQIDMTETCWNWNGSLNNGYGRSLIDGKPLYVHRFIYEFLVGPIPKGLHLDHLCRNTRCCNPEHLEAVTPKENLLRGETVNAKNAAKTQCIRGHEFNLTNTKIRKDGSRQCNVCVAFYRSYSYKQRNTP